MAEISNRILSITALISSSVAIGLLAYQSYTSSSEIEFVERIDELEREVDLLQGNVFPGGESELDLESRSADARYPSGGAGNVEGDVEEMRWAMTVRGFLPATEEHIERSTRIIFDESQNAKDKLTATRILRRSGRLGDAEVREMIAVFFSTENHSMQASILEALDGVTTPELAPTLLKASAESPSDRVRRQAVDTMSGFLPDPELEDWLRYVIKSDSESRVRDEARRLLKRFDSKVSNVN